MRTFVSLSLLVLAACPAPQKPGEEKPTPAPLASFGDATEEERAGAVMAALGFGPVYATFAQFQADMDARSVDDDNQPSGCPTLDVLGEDPLKVRYTGDGCTAPSGAVYDGALEVTNPLTWEDTMEGRAGATSMIARGFSVGDAFTIDGTWSQSETAPETDATAMVDLAATAGGQTLRLVGRVDLTWDDGVQRAVCGAGLRGGLDGLGEFGVACDFRDLGGASSGGFVTLSGEDTLKIDLAPDADGCFPATVDGEAVAPVCLSDDGGGGGGGGGGALDEEVFGGSGIGCMDDTIWLDAQTLAGAAGGVEMALAAPGSDTYEVHALAADPVWGDESYDGWTATLLAGAYQPGASTEVGCDDYETLHAVFFAYDVDGEVIGCRVAGYSGDVGPIDLSECPRV